MITADGEQMLRVWGVKRADWTETVTITDGHDFFDAAVLFLDQ